MAAGPSGIPWKAMLCHGREMKTDATERVPPNHILEPPCIGIVIVIEDAPVFLNCDAPFV